MFCRGPRGPLGDVLRRVGEDGAIDFRRTRDIAELRFPARAGMNVARTRGSCASPSPRRSRRMPALRVRPRARRSACRVSDALRAGRLFTHILTMGADEVDSLERPDHRGASSPRSSTTRRRIGVFGFLLGLYFILPYWEVSAGEAIWSFRRMAQGQLPQLSARRARSRSRRRTCASRPSAAPTCAPGWGRSASSCCGEGRVYAASSSPTGRCSRRTSSSRRRASGRRCCASSAPSTSRRSTSTA